MLKRTYRYVFLNNYRNKECFNDWYWRNIQCIYDYEIIAKALQFCGPGSVVGIATGYGLDGPGIEYRRGARFSAPVQTGLGTHPASCTIGIWSFPGVKSGRDVMLTPQHFLVPWSRKIRGIPLLPSTEPQCLYKGALYLFYLAILELIKRK
jgi:hypothetical protein